MHDTLRVVEDLYKEFYHPLTSNARKQEIEVQLDSIKATPNLGSLCIYFIFHTSSDFVIMFSLQTLHSIINQQWSKTELPLKEEIKAALEFNLAYKCDGVVPYLRNKYTKLLVDIARIDWPNGYPNFFDVVLQLLKCEGSNQLTGLILLKTICEEFMSHNANFESLDRKKEITRLLHSYIPLVFDLLNSILENVVLGIKSKQTVTATPPPSPTFQAPPANNFSLTGFSYKALGIEALRTIQLIFNWVPIEKIPAKLIGTIFNFMNSQHEELCIEAVQTIQEIFSKKCCPPGTEASFKQIFNYIVDWLRNIANYPIENYNELFVQKLCDLLKLLIEHYYWRFELDPAFNSLDFLSAFFHYTMFLSSVTYFQQCLEVWSVFFKQIKPNNAEKYSEVFLGLGNSLINKIQFSYNIQQLNEINMVNVDQENKSEWQYFLDSSVKIISQSARFIPLQIFNITINSWNLYNMEYKRLEKPSEIWFNNPSNLETEHLIYILRDYATLTFTLANLAHHFYRSENEELHRTATPTIYGLMENTLKSASSYDKIKLYILKFKNHKLTQSFIDAESELLSSLATWMCCMEARNQQCSNADVFLKLLLPFLKEGDKIPVQLSAAAAKLFLELARRPNNLCPLRHNAVAEFIHEIPKLKYATSDITNTVNSAICEILLKHLKSFDQETLQRYKLLIEVFFNGLTRDFRDLSQSSAEEKVTGTVANTLPALSHIVEYSSGFPVGAKKELTSAIKPTLDQALVLFPVYVNYIKVYDMFSNFFIAVLKNVQSQIGLDYTKHALQVFFHIASSEGQSKSLLGIHQLLDIFCTVIREITNKTLLPEILQVCMDHIYPVISQQAWENPDVFVMFLNLLHSILNVHWLHFYNSQVMLGYSPGCNDTEVGPDSPKRPEHLLAVLKVFGDALLAEDIYIFQRSLTILQDLNNNKKLYHKTLFRSHFLPDLLRVLLNTLLYKRHNISIDDIVFAIYSMAEVDFQGFFSTFLPQYIQNLNGVTASNYQVLIRHFNSNNDQVYKDFTCKVYRNILKKITGCRPKSL